MVLHEPRRLWAYPPPSQLFRHAHTPFPQPLPTISTSARPSPSKSAKYTLPSLPIPTPAPAQTSPCGAQKIPFPSPSPSPSLSPGKFKYACTPPPSSLLPSLGGGESARKSARPSPLMSTKAISARLLELEPTAVWTRGRKPKGGPPVLREVWIEVVGLILQGGFKEERRVSGEEGFCR